MGLGGGVAIEVFEESGAPTRGVGAILAGNAAARQPLPLARVGIAARVADRIVEVTVTQVFRNTFADPIEAVYVFPLDGGSVVSRFDMQVGERTLCGIVQERGAARQKYQRALDEGRRTALLEQERDDVFTVQLGNLPPGEDATIRLTYSEELTFFDNGLTELRLPLLLGVRYIAGEPLPGASAGHGTESDTDIVPDASRLTPPRLADGFDPQVNLSISVEIEGGHLADLACSQHATRLSIAGHRTTITLARADERLNRDFVLRWRVAAPGTIAPQLFFYRHPSGERYGIVSAASAAGTGHTRPRDVIFVLDRSGSMEGIKMASAARACGLLLNTLGPADRFGLLVFNEGTQWLIGGGADTLVQADRTGIARGERLLRELQANGGTELYPALLEGLDRVGSGDTTGRVPVIVLLTDGEVGDEARALELVQRAKARVFTVGVDTSVNTGLLKRLAQAGRGTFVLTEPGGALDDALAAIAREIGAPVVESLAIAVDGGTPTDVAPERLPDLFAGRAATIAFKADAGSTVRLTGRRADGSAFALEVQGTEVDLPAIAHLWARRRLTDLEDRYRLARGDDRKAIETEIVALSTSHGVLSRFTAFVVVDDQQAVVSTVDRRTIVQPVEMPHMWAPRSQAFPMASLAALAAFASGREDATTEAALEGGEREMVLRSVSSAKLGPSRSLLGRLTSRLSRPGASLTPNEPLERVIAEHVEGLLQLLRETDANGRDARVAMCRAAMDRIEEVLALIESIGGRKALELLVSALSRLRDGLRAAVDAEERLQIASRGLIDVWTELSQKPAPRGRFWENV